MTSFLSPEGPDLITGEVASTEEQEEEEWRPAEEDEDQPPVEEDEEWLPAEEDEEQPPAEEPEPVQAGDDEGPPAVNGKKFITVDNLIIKNSIKWTKHQSPYKF